jgi:biotin transporter BioY
MAAGASPLKGLFVWGFPIAILLIGIGNRRDKELWPVPQATMLMGVALCLINVIGLWA